jgi:cyclopropane-fatty-acyl-phospholipid synthase
LKRAAVRRACEHLTGVPFSVRYWNGQRDKFGAGAPQFEMTIRDPAVVWPVLCAPDPNFGDAYMHGAIDVDKLEPMLDALQMAPPPLPLPSGIHLPHPGTPVARQYKEVQSHYDLGNDFFSLWLDTSRTYSCAYFRRPSDSLETAQAAKIEHVLRKAQLKPGQRLLDIGCGWGALIMKAARKHRVLSSGITLSREQHAFVQNAIGENGLEERVGVRLCDYRELARSDETFDRIVSVGMLEHVGKRNLPVFLEAAQKLLKPGGVCVLHFISHSKEYEVGPWIKRHIFPGGYIPSWREVIALLPEFGFNLIDAESLRRHYARTLTEWANRFEAQLPAIRAQGFDEPFIRMWRLYLRGCAAGFRAGGLDLHQLVFTSGFNNKLAMTREHIYNGDKDYGA